MNVHDLLRLGPVIPVIVLDHLDHAVPLARALVAGGIRVLEVTLRTPVALDCIRAMCAEVPGAVVGAGTLLSAADIAAARAAGATFGVSPAATPALLAAARHDGMPFLPGVFVPSDVLTALEAGYTAMKLFPARQAGGVGALKALGGPFPQVTFCPTGGIDVASAPEYLALPNVACVGGSWLAPPELVAAGRWGEIEALARAAAALARP